MNSAISYLILISSFVFGSAPIQNQNKNQVENPITFQQYLAEEETPENTYRLSETQCASSFGGLVTTYTLKDGYSSVGHSIWLNRKGGKAKAKYFAHKQDNEHVHHRYTMWRVNKSKNIILKSSGTYATGWNNSDLPVGVTVDNGTIVNRNYSDKMDGLVVVYATGGIAVSNIEDKDLRLESLNREVDITNAADRAKFLNWAQSEDATVFQTHLLAYKNKNQVSSYNSEPETARRKILALAKDSSGQLFHIILYFKDQEYSLYDATNLALNYLRSSKQMDVIAMINLDTGGYDILNTAGGATDCNDNSVWGTEDNYDDMTNLLTYHFE